MCGQMDPQPRESVFGHGMVCPVFQDAQPLPNRLLVTDQPAPAQQLVSDPRLLSDKPDLRGERIGIEVRQLSCERRAPRVPELFCHFPEEAHHIIKEFSIVHIEKPVFQPQIDLPPGFAHHLSETVVTAEGHRDGISLGEAFLHRMCPCDIGQRLFRDNRTSPL